MPDDRDTHDDSVMTMDSAASAVVAPAHAQAGRGFWPQEVFLDSSNPPLAVGTGELVCSASRRAAQRGLGCHPPEPRDLVLQSRSPPRQPPFSMPRSLREER